MERKEIFSIKKLKVGAASVLIGTGIVFLGSEVSVALANESVGETTVNRTNSDDVNDNSVNPKNSLNNDKMGVNSSTTHQQVDTNFIKPTENNSNSSNVNTTSEVSDLENKPNIVDKKDMDIVINKNRKKISKRSKRELPDSETIDYSGAKISGRLIDGKTQYAVGEQILGSYNLDVSAPTKIEEGGYILITASNNEPLDTFEIGSSLRFEKVNNNQYKLYTGELSGGAYANINVSYKLKKFETGKDSNTTIKAELFDKNNTLIKSTDFSNTNKTGTPYVSVDTRNGIRRQTLLETNQQETEIDVSKSKDLQLSLKSTNKEAAAITKIDHAVELPAGVTIAQTSLDAGWRLENGVAKYTRLVPSSTTMFASGDNTQNELLYLNVSNGGTPAEFLTGKKLTFKDNATYTDKSGFTNTTSDDVTVMVRALNPKKYIGGSNSGSGPNPNNNSNNTNNDQTNPSGNNSGTGGSTVPTRSNVRVGIFNTTMEDNESRVVNIAMPYINTKTEDTRIIQLSGDYGDSYGPASVKEVEISIDSNIDQNRAIEFYAIWTPTDKGESTFVSHRDNPESLGLNSTLTFEVYSVTNGTESKIGEVSFRKGDVADKVALPDGTTTVKLKPKGNMPLETAGLQAVGLFLSQDLKGLEEAKKLAKEGNKVESIVTASVYTHGYEEPKVAVSKTTFAYSRDAIKLVPTTNPITTTLAGNLTQELSSQYEVYEYSPNGLGNRIYYKQIWDRKTYVYLQDIAAKNAKLLVELPDGFSYAGNNSSVKTVENYNNSGKTVLEVKPWRQHSGYTLSPDLQFKVDNWVPAGKYPVKYTLVWNEDERVVGINPNNDYDGTNANITNTSTFTYELPVINNSATRLITQVTDQPTDSSTYSTGVYNLAPNDEVKYRLSLTNSSNVATGNNVVISTLPRVSDKNIVLNSKDRGSQFDVHMTAAATTPEGWTAYYSTTPVSGTAVELEKTITLTADQITDWSTVTAVKFVSNQDASLKAGSTAAFYLPAKVSSTATNNQVAVLTSATRTDGQDTFNETNPVRISVKIEDVKKGAVKVAYENKDNVPIKDTVTAIESRAYKKGYDVDTKEYKPNTLIGKDGKEYYFVKVKESSPSPTGTIDSPEVTVTYVYDLLYDETEESHTVTRTIKYVDASNETTEVSPKVVQNVTLTRTNKRNKVTNALEEGTWTQGSWAEQASPTVANYGTPDKASVALVAVTPTMENEEVVVKYTQAVDTKTVATKQTVTYEGAGTSTPAPNEQTDYTFTGKTNKVTNVTTWNEETHTYGVVTTPKVEGYYADKAQAGGKEVTPTNPEASDKVVYKPLGKVILVDEGGNEIPNTQKPTYRNNPNNPTVGGETPIPEIPEGYEIKPKQVVPGFNQEGKVVTPPKPGEDTRIVLVEVNQKATVTYVVEGTNTVLHTEKLEGKSGEPINYTTVVKLAELKVLGYELVTDGFVTATDKNFDNNSKVDQTFLVTVAKTVPVTPTTPQNPKEDPKNPNPGDPIDPKNPTGPKWTKEALDKLNNIKSVTRTITYIKDGTEEEVSPIEAPKVTNKVSFTRTVVVNSKDGSVVGYDKTGDGIADVPATDTTSGWVASGTAKFTEVKSPVVKGYVVKPNQDTQGDLVEADGSKVKASITDLTVDSANQDLKVRYVPVGKVTITVPPGVTPPTPVTDTPYGNDPKDPGKVVPPSPTKPQDPQDPNSPKVPVIPHIPATIPQVPKDPTKPVGPNNPLVPLTPVDPKDPSKGYNVPPVPTDPTVNTPVNYAKDEQKAITNFVDNNGKVVSDPVFDQGGSGTRFTKSREVESKIKELVKKGYIVVSNDYPSVDTDRVFDNDKGKDQIFNVTVTPLIVPTDPNSPDKPQVPTDPTKPVGPNTPLRPVTPSTPDPGKPVFPGDPNSPKWPESVRNLVTETTATRIITYVDQNGKEVAATHIETIKFKRSAKVNLVTGEITYGDWTVVGDDSILDGNPLPPVDGYIARGGDINASQEDIKATAGMNIIQTVVYDKFGSWVPKVPEGVTPVHPITYPNDPKDPTKPGTDKPRVPHVPGFIPVGPNGTPLKPVDSKDPSKGYEVPDVPKDPTKDTPISYVPVTPEKPTPERKTPKPTPVVPVQPEGPVTPKMPDVPTKPTRLANTGATETNTGLAGLGLGILGGLLAAARRRKNKED